MPTRQCGGCKNEVPRQAHACPHCGIDLLIGLRKLRNASIIWLCVAAICYGLGGVIHLVEIKDPDTLEFAHQCFFVGNVFLGCTIIGAAIWLARLSKMR